MRSRPTEGREGRICVAQVGAAHGLKGEVRVFSFTENPEDFRRYGPLQSKDGKRTLTIAAVRPGRDHFVVKFEGIDDRDAADLLRNMELYVARDSLPAPSADDTFYHADLLGLTATYRDGARAGEVIAVHNFGAGDLLEIRRDGADALLVPFTEQAVPVIDLAAQQIVIDPPAEIAGEPQPGDEPTTLHEEPAAASPSPPPLWGRSVAKQPGGGSKPISDQPIPPSPTLPRRKSGLPDLRT
ncbi:MAG: ribosome maturation factor RimM [Pseudorhodoplanes sp.]